MKAFWALFLTAGVALGAPASTDPELEKAIHESPAKAAEPAKPATPSPLPTLGTPPPLSTAPTALPLVDVFSMEKNPGRGTLEYSKGGEIEKIVLGPESGQYLVGMVFPHDTLPRSLQNEFKKQEAIQLVFGTLNAKAGSRVGQFGTATLWVLRQTQTLRTLPLRIPGTADPTQLESAFLLFTSPEMQAQLSDEEKLKGTFFAREGAIILGASAPPKTLQVPLEGRKIPFKMQAMRMEIHASLTTPFNSEEHKLQGKVEFPLYWPEGPSGRRLAREMAETAFNAKSSIEIPEEFSASRRQVTAEPGNPPKKRKPSSNNRP